MKKTSWSLVTGHPRSARSVRRLTFPAWIITIVALCSAGGLVGGAIFLKDLGTYAFAQITLLNEEKTHHDLIEKMKFLELLTLQKESRIDSLVAFEDKARLIYGMESISPDIRKVGVGGAVTSQDLLANSFAGPGVSRALNLQSKMDELMRRIHLQKETFVSVKEFVQSMSEKWAQRPAILPVSGRLTSSFGFRDHPILGVRKFHEGIDIANSEWTPIKATADGIVSFEGYNKHFGNTVTLRHYDSGYSTTYAHLREIAVIEGQPVKRGDIIGYLGNTGQSTGPHLHYEVVKAGRNLNPADYILPSDTLTD